MECRLVLNNRTNINITDKDMSGYLHQHLKFYKFRRVPTKSGKSIFYLFFRTEQETYYALRAARSIKTISLVRYRPSEPIPFEPPFRPFAPQRIIDILRFAFANRVNKFDSMFDKSVAIVLPLSFSLAFENDNGQHNGTCTIVITNNGSKSENAVQEEKAESELNDLDTSGNMSDDEEEGGQTEQNRTLTYAESFSEEETKSEQSDLDTNGELFSVPNNNRSSNLNNMDSKVDTEVNRSVQCKACNNNFILHIKNLQNNRNHNLYKGNEENKPDTNNTTKSSNMYESGDHIAKKRNSNLGYTFSTTAATVGSGIKQETSPINFDSNKFSYQNNYNCNVFRVNQENKAVTNNTKKSSVMYKDADHISKKRNSNLSYMFPTTAPMIQNEIAKSKFC